jgi:hypothetical protein
MQQKVENYKLGNDKILLYRNIIYVPNSHELRSMILKEMHNVPYARHPGYYKTIVAVKSQYYWPGVKKKLLSTLLNVWSVKRSRMNIDTQLGCCSNCQFLSGSEKW